MNMSKKANILPLYLMLGISVGTPNLCASVTDEEEAPVTCVNLFLERSAHKRLEQVREPMNKDELVLYDEQGTLTFMFSALEKQTKYLRRQDRKNDLAPLLSLAERTLEELDGSITSGSVTYKDFMRMTTAYGLAMTRAVRFRADPSRAALLMNDEAGLKEKIRQIVAAYPYVLFRVSTQGANTSKAMINSISGRAEFVARISGDWAPEEGAKDTWDIFDRDIFTRARTALFRQFPKIFEENTDQLMILKEAAKIELLVATERSNAQFRDRFFNAVRRLKRQDLMSAAQEVWYQAFHEYNLPFTKTALSNFINQNESSLRSQYKIKYQEIRSLKRVATSL